MRVVAVLRLMAEEVMATIAALAMKHSIMVNACVERASVWYWA